MSKPEIRVLMVCLGNICRSPTAEAVFRHQVKSAQLEHCIMVDSAGTSDWHVGEQPDRRSMRHAALRNYDLSDQRSRQVRAEDFIGFDYIVAMDSQNLRDLEAVLPTGSKAQLQLLLGAQGVKGYIDVPDPYSGGASGFDLVLDLIEAASTRLLAQLVQNHALSTAAEAVKPNV